jgi:hypothetical protein
MVIIVKIIDVLTVFEIIAFVIVSFTIDRKSVV